MLGITVWGVMVQGLAVHGVTVRVVTGRHGASQCCMGAQAGFHYDGIVDEDEPWDQACEIQQPSHLRTSPHTRAHACTHTRARTHTIVIPLPFPRTKFKGRETFCFFFSFFLSLSYSCRQMDSTRLSKRGNVCGQASQECQFCEGI